MRLFKRRYRSKNQKAAMAGVTYGMVFLCIVMFIIFSAQTPGHYNDQEQGVRHQDQIVAEFIHRVDGRGQF